MAGRDYSQPQTNRTSQNEGPRRERRGPSAVAAGRWVQRSVAVIGRVVAAGDGVSSGAGKTNALRGEKVVTMGLVHQEGLLQYSGGLSVIRGVEGCAPEPGVLRVAQSEVGLAVAGSEASSLGSGAQLAAHTTTAKHRGRAGIRCLLRASGCS